MKIKKDKYNNTTYQFKQKVSENNQVYLHIGRSFDDKLSITIHNGDYDRQHIEVEGIDFSDLFNRVEYRIDIENCDRRNITDEIESELLTLEF